MNFDLPEELVVLRDAARAFADQELAPRAARHDEAESFVEEQVRMSAEQGYLGMCVPEAYGGSDLGSLGCSLVLMEINRACASTGVTLSVHNSLVCEALVRYGSEALRQRFLPAIARGECCFALGMSEPGSGSDLASVRTRAERVPNGWRVTGQWLVSSCCK